MRVVTFGYQSWGHRTLSAVLGTKHEVVLAVTHPKTEHPYEQMWEDSVADLAHDHQIPVHVATRADDELIARVQAANADVIIANNWRTLLPREIYDAPVHGTLNVHDSLLPRYAGFSPILWALLNRETHVGVTVHQMDDGLDTGPIVAQQAIPVRADHTTTELVSATMDLIEPLVVRSLTALDEGTLRPIAQDPAQWTYFHKRSALESKIDFHADAAEIELLIRAQSDPYPNAHFDFEGRRIRVLSAHVSQGAFGGTPGRVTIAHEDGVAVVCGSARRNAAAPAIVLEQLRLEDGTEIPATDFFGARGGYITT